MVILVAVLDFEQGYPGKVLISHEQVLISAAVLESERDYFGKVAVPVPKFLFLHES